jgi:hypothetical protein
MNQNQLAIEAAIMELTLWAEQPGSAGGAGNVRWTQSARTKSSSI